MSTTDRPYRRNYKMMDLAKLARSINEMEDQRGEGYDKVIDHDGDLTNEIARAREVLAEKRSRL
jgi:hypothetical protein